MQAIPLVSMNPEFSFQRLTFDQYYNLTMIFWQFVMRCAIWYHLYNFKNVKNTQWRSVNFSKVPGFSFFLNCANGTKSRNAPHLLCFSTGLIQHKYKSSLRRCSVKRGVLKNFAIFHRKTLVLESLFNKVAGLKACSFIKKRLQNRCFSVNIMKFLRIPLLKNICGTAASASKMELDI